MMRQVSRRLAPVLGALLAAALAAGVASRGERGGAESITAAQAPPRYGPPVLVARFQDDRIRESSGLAASARSDEYFFTHNDSGDGPVVYAVDRRGQTLGIWRLKGGAALDWEDMARGPGPGGEPALYIGDIGDNFRFRGRISVYRVREPAVDTNRAVGEAPLEGVTRFDLEYPDGAHDAETLMVHPTTGRLFVVTKQRGVSEVYAAPERLDPTRVNRLQRIATIEFDRLPALGEKRSRKGELATGGDFSPDGERLVVRTYREAFEWTIPDSVAGAFEREPVAIALPKDGSGEAIGYSRSGRSLLTTTEGRNAPVHEIPRE